MDIIEFRRMAIFNENFGEHIHAEIIINGKPFAEIAEEFERLAVERGRGKYNGFEYVYEYASVLYESLANDKSCDENPEQKPLMICSGCHEAGCWGLYVTVDVDDNEIVWHDINNYHLSRNRPDRNWWDYSVFPSYRFNQVQYGSALEQLKQIASEPHRGWYER